MSLIDFSPCGLNYTWEDNDASHARLSDDAYLSARLAVVDDSNLSTVLSGYDSYGDPIYRFQADTPAAGGIPAIRSEIIMNRRTYVVEDNMGSGVFGIVAKVREVGSVPPRLFALKRQDATTDGFLQFIREAVIHYTLFSRTRDPATNSSDYVPNFIFMGKGNDRRSGRRYIYFLTELMENTLQNVLLPANGNNELQARFIINFLRQITPRLEFLFNNCNYNHGDFKTDNVMYNAAGQYKLIDFGFSRLQIRGRLIEANPTYCNYSEQSRDLSQMLWSINYVSNLLNTYSYGGGLVTLPNKLHKVITTVLRECICDGKDGHHFEHFKDLATTSWENTYYFFNSAGAAAAAGAGVLVPVLARNGHRNMAGTFEAVNRYLAWINSSASDAPAASVPLTHAHIAALSDLSTNANFDVALRRRARQAALTALMPPPFAPAPAGAAAVRRRLPAAGAGAPGGAPPPGGAAVAAAALPRLIARIRDNPGTIAFAIALTAIAAYNTYARFFPPSEPQAGGKKVKRRTQKNLKRLQRHARKVSRKRN